MVAYPNLIQRERGPVARLVISADAIASNDELPTVTTLLVFPDDSRGGLLSIRVGDIGWASALSPEASLRSRLGEVLHTCAPDELESLDRALRVAHDL